MSEEQPKFKVCIEKPLLNRLFRYTEPLIAEISPYFTNEGLYICEVDLAHVVMYNGFIAKSKFKEYELNRDARITVDISRLKLSTTLSKKNVTLIFNAKHNRLQVDEHAKIGLLENCIRPNEPTLDLPIEINEITEEKITIIKKMIEIGKKISDTVHFIIDEQKTLYLTVEGEQDTYKKPIVTKIKIKKDTKLPVKSIYSTDYLSLIFNNIDTKDTITIKLGQDKPMKVNYGDNEEKHMFLIAPRIEEEVNIKEVK